MVYVCPYLVTVGLYRLLSTINWYISTVHDSIAISVDRGARAASKMSPPRPRLHLLPHTRTPQQLEHETEYYDTLNGLVPPDLEYSQSIKSITTIDPNHLSSHASTHAYPA